MFISNVSHELRTPMAALIGEVELSLHKDRTDDEYREILETVLTDARKIERLSLGLLDLAKVSYNKDQISMSNVRLDETLIDAFSVIIKANTNYSVEFISEDDNGDDKMVTVIGNEYLLRTAFVNLIENNCKF